MAGIDEFQMAFLIEDAEEHSGVAADLGVIAEEAVDMIEDARGIDAQSHSGERALKHGGDNRGAESLTGNVRDKKRRPAIAQREDIEVISADRQAGEIESGDREMRVFSETAREKPLLDVAGDIDFLLEALAFTLAFNEAGVVQNVRSVGGQGVQNLAVQFRESRGAARIQIENSEKFSAPDIDHGLLRIRARDGEERNHHHRSQTLRDDALCGLRSEEHTSELQS